MTAAQQQLDIDGATPNMLKQVHMKVRDGWESRTDVAISPTRLLRIVTHKCTRGGVFTSGTVYTVHADHPDHMSTMLFEDFSRVFAHNAMLRVTDKTVSAQHFCVLQDLDAIKLEVLTFYASKDHAQAVVAAPFAFTGDVPAHDFGGDGHMRRLAASLLHQDARG